MARLLLLAREARHEVVKLHAQTHAREFYGKLGFVAEGPERLGVEGLARLDVADVQGHMVDHE